MKKYRHLFFDLDHTLWDFEANSSYTLKMLFEHYQLAEKLQTTPEHFLENYYRINDQKWALYRAGEINKEQLRASRFLETFAVYGFKDAAFGKRFDKEYIAQSPYQKKLIEGTLELLDHLSRQEEYQLHIITNGFAEIQDIKLTHSGLKDYFEVIMTSERVGATKPHARIFVEAMRMAGAERKNSLMIGDSLTADVLGAKRCGIDQVYYNPSRIVHGQQVTYEISTLLELKGIL